MIDQYTIPTELIGSRMDAALAALFPDYSRTQLCTALKNGMILIDGGKCKPKDKVQGHETIQVNWGALTTPQPSPLQPEAMPLTIVFEDEHLLVINKPAGLVVHPGAGNPAHTLVNALLFHEPSLALLPRAGILHRLDKLTTGLLLVAKTQAAYTFLGQQMRARCIHREYFALVQGQIRLPSTLTTCFGRHPHQRLKMAVTRVGKEAITNYQPVQSFQHFTLLSVSLVTGRTHQIRVHLAYLKHPVVGDPVYGIPLPLAKLSGETLIEHLAQFKRQALHAHTLSFLHPETKQSVAFTAPLPEDMQQLIHLLEQYDV